MFGFIYRKTIVTVDRTSPEHRAKSVLILKSILRRGISALVFPEGTFNTTYCPLKHFYDGAFRLAVDTGKPIVPALVFNTKKVLPVHKTFYMLPHKLEMHFLPPVNTENISAKDLKEKVFKMMWDYYEAKR